MLRDDGLRGPCSVFLGRCHAVTIAPGVQCSQVIRAGFIYVAVLVIAVMSAMPGPRGTTKRCLILGRRARPLAC